MKRVFWKKVFSCLLSLSLAIPVTMTYLPDQVYASETTQATEVNTDVNLLSSEEASENSTQAESSTEKKGEEKLPDTGISYALDGMSGSPDITAESAILMDARSGGILYAKQAEEIRYPASITKVMTALLAIENCNMDDIVEFTNEAVNSIEAGSSSAGINAGAMLTVEDTLYALMLVSANEAGAALAEHIAGSNDAFAKMMTDRAKELGCTNTQFKNPHGLPDEEHYTTAHDMGLIMKECIKHEEFRKLAGTISYTIKSDTLDESSIELLNHAKILRDSSDYYYQYVKGAKTGFTQAALNTLVTYAEKDGVQLLCIILKDHGAEQSYYDTKHLYEWGFEQVKNTTPMEGYDLTTAIENDENLTNKQKKAYGKLTLSYDTSTPLLLGNSFDENTLTKVFRVDEDVNAGRIGYIDLMDGDTTVMSTAVTFDTNDEAGQAYIKKYGKDEEEASEENSTESDDGLKTAKVENKNSLLRKMIIFLIRLVIACLLIYLIMQWIRKRELEKKRKERMQKRQHSRQAKNPASGSSKNPTVRNTKSNTKSSTPSSSGSQTPKKEEDTIRRRRRSNKSMK